MISSAWVFGTEPFPAFRVSLVYGRNKRDREFLAVKDVVPSIQYSVKYAYTTLYEGTDKVEAEAAKAKFYEDNNAKLPEADLKVGLQILPEGEFQLIKTKEKGTILVVPGKDNTNRCLLFVGCGGGFRGSVDVIEDATTGSILKKCSAGNNCESSVEVVVLLEVGQSIVFHSTGRHTDEVYTHTWNGLCVVSKHYSNEEWITQNINSEDAERL